MLELILRATTTVSQELDDVFHAATIALLGVAIAGLRRLPSRDLLDERAREIARLSKRVDGLLKMLEDRDRPPPP